MWFVARSAVAFPLSIPFSTAISIACAGAGALIALLAIRQFRSAGTTTNPLCPEKASSLVRSGIFSRSRNPMYVGLLLVLAGWSIWLGSLGSVLVLVAFYILITELQIKPEEVALKRLFGDEYSDYCKDVGRWF